jgi:hypothetical protein
VNATAQHVLCAVGAGWDADRLADVVARTGGDGFGFELEAGPDPRMSRAFDVSADRVVPSFTEADHAAVAAHRAVAYVVAPPHTAEQALEFSQRVLTLTAALLHAGAAAVKHESSGIAHGRDRWLSLASSAGAARDAMALAPVLYLAFVRRPLADGLLFYTCGMHLLGEADIELTAADDDDGLDWMDALAGYLLIERGSGGIDEGDTFGFAADSPRRVLRHRPCTRYPPDDLCHNPYGYWRLTGS